MDSFTHQTKKKHHVAKHNSTPKTFKTENHNVNSSVTHNIHTKSAGEIFQASQP